MKNLENVIKASEEMTIEEMKTLVNTTHVDVENLTEKAKIYLAMLKEFRSAINTKKYEIVSDSLYTFSNNSIENFQNCDYARIISTETKKSIIQVYFKEKSGKFHLNLYFSSDRRYEELINEFSEYLNIENVRGKTRRITFIDYTDIPHYAKCMLAILSLDEKALDIMRKKMTEESEETSA